MPTPSSLFASAIPISSLKLAGIKHPPPHPFSSHSFSIPLPHLHGVSWVHAILDSFTYPLKPLTQASISIQPIPILHATHNHVLPYPCIHPFNHTTKLVSLSKPSPTCGILPKKCHVALSSLHTQTVPLAMRDIVHSTRGRILFGRCSTFSGYLTSGILSGRRSTFSEYLTSGILSDRRSTFSGYLTSGILSCRCSHFSIIILFS